MASSQERAATLSETVDQASVRSGKRKPSGITPTIVAGRPLTRTARPTTAASPP